MPGRRREGSPAAPKLGAPAIPGLPARPLQPVLAEDPDLARFSPVILLILLGAARPSPAAAPADGGAVALSGPVIDAAPGGVGAYIAAAMQQSPALQAAYSRWQAAIHRIARSRRLPEPNLGFGIFLRSVETRVGPQQARLSLQQAFPWPTSLSRGADAATADARAAEDAFEALSLELSNRVALAYWDLWELRAARATHQDHLVVLDGLSASARARVEVGAATLADLQQVDLTRARLADRLRALDEKERAMQAVLGAFVALPGPMALPTTEAPPAPVLPAEARSALLTAIVQHPDLQRRAHLVDAAEAAVGVARTQRLPGFSLGADWILTGPSPMPDVADSGKDALMLGLGVKLPLWQRGLSEDVDAARAQAEALRLDWRARDDLAGAQLEQALAALDDSARRVNVTEARCCPKPRPPMGP